MSNGYTPITWGYLNNVAYTGATPCVGYFDSGTILGSQRLLQPMKSLNSSQPWLTTTYVGIIKQIILELWILFPYHLVLEMKTTKSLVVTQILCKKHLVERHTAQVILVKRIGEF